MTNIFERHIFDRDYNRLLKRYSLCKQQVNATVIMHIDNITSTLLLMFYIVNPQRLVINLPTTTEHLSCALFVLVGLVTDTG